MSQPERDDSDDTQEIDMAGVFATDQLINDLLMGQVPPDERMAEVLDAWRRQVGTESGDDPAVTMWEDAINRAAIRAQQQQDPSLLTALIEFIAGVILVVRSVAHLVKLALDALIRLLAQLPWKQPRPWE